MIQHKLNIKRQTLTLRSPSIIHMGQEILKIDQSCRVNHVIWLWKKESTEQHFPNYCIEISNWYSLSPKSTAPPQHFCLQKQCDDPHRDLV